MYAPLDRNSRWPDLLCSTAHLSPLKQQWVPLRGVSTVTEPLLKLPVKNRTFQRDEEESIFTSLSLRCDRSKWEFSVFHCSPWRPYGNVIHTFFPADLLGRFKAPHLSVWAHPRDLARSLTGVLAHAYITAARDGSLGLLWPVVICIDIVISFKPLHWLLPAAGILNRTETVEGNCRKCVWFQNVTRWFYSSMNHEGAWTKNNSIWIEGLCCWWCSGEESSGTENLTLKNIQFHLSRQDPWKMR